MISMETVSLVRALAIGQLAQHGAKHAALTDKVVQLRAELKHTLRLLAAEEIEVSRFSCNYSIVRKVKQQ